MESISEWLVKRMTGGGVENISEWLVKRMTGGRGGVRKHNMLHIRMAS